MENSSRSFPVRRKRKRIIKIYSRDYRAMLLEPRKRNSKDKLIRMHQALRNTPVGQYLHWQDGDYKITVLPVWRWGKYHVTYYLRYGTDVPLDQIKASDVIYIDKHLPRAMHWCFMNLYKSRSLFRVKGKLMKTFMKAHLIQPDLLRHFYYLSRHNFPLINMLTLHAILSYYVGVRNRLGSINMPHRPERYTLNPYKFLTNKMGLSRSRVLSLLNQGFSVMSDDAVPRILDVLRIASELEVRPDALVGVPFLLLVHPRLQTVTIIGPHRTYYPVTFDRALYALSNYVDPESLEQISETLRSVVNITQQHLRDLYAMRSKKKDKRVLGWERFLISKRTSLDYKYMVSVMHATMASLERRHAAYRTAERKTFNKTDIKHIMGIIAPTGEMHESLQCSFEKEQKIRETVEETGIPRPGETKITYLRVYDLDYEPT